MKTEVSYSLQYFNATDLIVWRSDYSTSCLSNPSSFATFVKSLFFIELAARRQPTVFFLAEILHPKLESR